MSKHYKNGIEPIDYMKSNFKENEFKGFLRGNIVKYITRYPNKGGIEDLEKAQWYLQRLIEEEQTKKTADDCSKNVSRMGNLAYSIFPELNDCNIKNNDINHSGGATGADGSYTNPIVSGFNFKDEE